MPDNSFRTNIAVSGRNWPDRTQAIRISGQSIYCRIPPKMVWSKPDTGCTLQGYILAIRQSWPSRDRILRSTGYPVEPWNRQGTAGGICPGSLTFILNEQRERQREKERETFGHDLISVTNAPVFKLCCKSIFNADPNERLKNNYSICYKI